MFICGSPVSSWNIVFRIYNAVYRDDGSQIVTYNVKSTFSFEGQVVARGAQTTQSIAYDGQGLDIWHLNLVLRCGDGTTSIANLVYNGNEWIINER